MRSTQLTAALVAVMAMTAVAVPAVAGTAATGDLTVSVDQPAAGDEATVTVTANGTTVTNATVGVATVNDTRYEGNGTYLTGENGTVTLPAPAENVTVNVTASADNSSATTQVTLLAESNASSDDGTADDPWAVTPDGPFGQAVAEFVHSLLDNGGVDGRTVSEFVVEHNPGADHRSDDAGPGSEAAENASENSESDDGPGSDDHADDASDDHGDADGHGEADEASENGHGPDDTPGSEHAKADDAEREDGESDDDEGDEEERDAEANDA